MSLSGIYPLSFYAGGTFMNCWDILKIKGLEEIVLAGGKSGMDRNIRWIYFADALGTDRKIGNWISGGEIVVFANGESLSDREKTKKMMKSAFCMNAACIMIDEEYMHKDFAAYADELGFPLFILPLSVRAVDLSQTICTHIINEHTESSTLERILNAILFTGYDSEGRIISNAAYYGLDLRRKCSVSVFSPVNLSEYLETKNISDRETIDKIKNSYYRIVKNAFSNLCGRKLMSMLLQDNVIVLHDTEELSKDKYQRLFADIRRGISFSFPSLEFCVGVGNGYDSVSELKKSYREAVKTVKLCPAVNEGGLLFFRDLGIYSLLFSIDDEKSLQRYYKTYLGKLMEYDELNNTELCRTLDVYLSKNQNANLTAEALYIHRNTLRYRLDKIKSLLDDNLENLSSAANYMIAFKIRNYLNSLKTDD